VSPLLDNAATAAKLSGSQLPPTLRSTVSRYLEAAEENDTASRMVDIFLIFLIALSVTAVILESILAFERAYGAVLDWLEVITISVFSLEYILRIWSCVENPNEFSRSNLERRIRFIFSFHAIIDLLAILPFYMLAFGVLDTVDMRFLRAIRLVRVLKLTRYFPALNMLIVAVKENSQALAASFVILVTIMLLAASGMYYFERVSQPVDFGSIPAAMWWAFATLTTVGYGDVTPITVGGKIFGALITVVGIGMVALPTSILASGYSQQLELSRDAYRDKATEAFDDGHLDATEIRDLESLRVDLGLGKHTASQILDERKVRRLLQEQQESATCPHCHKSLA